MVMNMGGLQSGTTALEKADVLKDFMIVPTQMSMQRHMLGAMLAPHNGVTLMAMANYQHNVMQMEGAHQHIHGEHKHPIGHHEMSSTGIGDVKLYILLTLWKMPHLMLLANTGVYTPRVPLHKLERMINFCPILCNSGWAPLKHIQALHSWDFTMLGLTVGNYASRSLCIPTLADTGTETLFLLPRGERGV